MRFLVGAVVSLALSCSSGGGTMERPACEALGHRCHAAGASPNATATQRECHDKAHEGWTNAECLAHQSSCEAVCPLSADGG